MVISGFIEVEPVIVAVGVDRHHQQQDKNIPLSIVHSFQTFGMNRSLKVL
jgi:hypothetical protein